MFLDDVKKINYKEYGWSNPLENAIKSKVLKDILLMNKFIFKAKDICQSYEILNLIEEQYIVWDAGFNVEVQHNQNR